MSIEVAELLCGKSIDFLDFEQRQNFYKLHSAVNVIRRQCGIPMFPTNCVRTPQEQIEIYDAINSRRIATGLPPLKVPMNSWHMKACAADFGNKFIPELKEWCRNNEEFLKHVPVWIEDFSYTPNWVHIQIMPYATWKPGMSVFFKPY